ATHIARGFLLRLHAPELDARRALGDIAREPAPLEVVGAMLEMALELVVHLALDRGRGEQAARDGAEAGEARVHSDSGVARSAAVMPATTCSQLDRSSRSCFRPSGVSV